MGLNLHMSEYSIQDGTGRMASRLIVPFSLSLLLGR